LGDEEIISRNKETINNPAIAAPINIGDPICPAALTYAREIPPVFLSSADLVYTFVHSLSTTFHLMHLDVAMFQPLR
jgi:hypothetical protein